MGLTDSQTRLGGLKNNSADRKAGGSPEGQELPKTPSGLEQEKEF